MFGSPCENPVPTGCSTKSKLDKLVQLYSFCVGCAWPYDHWNGYCVPAYVSTDRICA